VVEVEVGVGHAPPPPPPHGDGAVVVEGALDLMAVLEEQRETLNLLALLHRELGGLCPLAALAVMEGAPPGLILHIAGDRGVVREHLALREAQLGP
jgi:hypothetical protein